MVWIVGLAVGLMHWPGSAQAHKLHMFVSLEGNVVAGRVYYSRTVPFKNGVIELLSIKGEHIAQTKSNAQGRFRLSLPKPAGQAARFIVRTKSSDGHLIEQLVHRVHQQSQHDHDHDHTSKPDHTHDHPASHNPAVPDAALAGPSLSQQDLQTVLAQELRPLKEQLHQLQSKIWLHEILGGLGLLCGVFGLWMFMLAGRARSS